MGCTSSKESTPRDSKRDKLFPSDTSLPSERYLSDPPAKHVKFASSSNDGTRGSGEAVRPKEAGSSNIGIHGSGEAARPKETFEAYARRGVIRRSALVPAGTQSKFTENMSQKKRVGGYEKYTRE
ncbi:MAG: hypothetical protein Q9161_008539 [Pseudevernia consocians]